MSDALINIRLTLRLAERRGLVRRADRLRLCGLARSLHFVERRYATLFAGARAAGLGSPSALDALADWVAHNAVDQKHADALSLLSNSCCDARFASRSGPEWPSAGQATPSS